MRTRNPGSPSQPRSRPGAPPRSRTGARASLSSVPPAGLEGRRIAALVLEAVLETGQPLERAFDQQAAPLAALEPRDRGFVHEIVLETLRHLPLLRAVLARLIAKPLPADAGRARAILLVGAAQICCLGTPPHAAVSLAVEHCRHERAAGRYAKLANAVLRRCADAAADVRATWSSPRDDIPAWLWARWESHYGAEAAQRIAAASLRRPPLDLTPKADPAAWAATLGAQLLPTGSLRLADAGPVAALAGFAEGAWWVQDAAAALPARLLGDVAGRRIADLCAAPGGKTAQLAAAGAIVTAVDRSAARLERLQANLARLGLADRVRVVAADAVTWRPDEPFDAVLLDAPCSATGTIRRHPDILHTKQPADIARLAELQHSLLAHAVDLVRPGGQLVYCTCSLEPEEGEAQVARLLADRPDLARAPIDAAAIGADADWITPAGDLRTLPCHLPAAAPELSGMDGFFAARLQR